jgi:hypothetical protein
MMIGVMYLNIDLYHSNIILKNIWNTNAEEDFKTTHQI